MEVLNFMKLTGTHDLNTFLASIISLLKSIFWAEIV